MRPRTEGDGTVVLLTGMSGAGKTTALRELAARGYATQDLDYDGYAYLEPAPDEPVGWEQLWHLDKVRALIERHLSDGDGGALFLAGTVRNQGELYDSLDAVVLLTAPPEVLLHRIEARTDNPFGKDAPGRAQIEHDIRTVEPLLHRRATHVLTTTAPVAATVAALEQIAAAIPSK